MPDSSKSFIDKIAPLGAVGSALIVVGGLIWSASANINNNNSSISQVAHDQQSFRVDVTKRLDEITAQIAGLPDQRASAAANERRISDNSVKNTDQDTRLNKIEQDNYQIKSDVSILQRTLGAMQNMTGRPK